MAMIRPKAESDEDFLQTQHPHQHKMREQETVLCESYLSSVNLRLLNKMPSHYCTIMGYRTNRLNLGS
jgi:hypothetical protein